MAAKSERTPLLKNEPSRQRINSQNIPELYSSYNHNNRSRAIKAGAIILLMEAFERFAYYSINGNLMLFLCEDPYSWTYFDSMQVMYAYLGFSYLMSVIGGWLGDSVLGRFKILVASFLFYWGGFILLLLLSIQSKTTRDSYTFLSNLNFSLPNCAISEGVKMDKEILDPTMPPVTMTPSLPPSTPCLAWVYFALILISIGAGMFKANIAPFGADQVLHLGEKATRSFFNWFYWCTNIGSLLALGPIAYVQQNYDFFIGYLIPFLVIVFATILFICCYPLYSVSPPGSTIMTNIIRIIFHAVRSSFRRIFCRRSSSSHRKGIIDPNQCQPVMWLDVAKVRHGGPFHDAIVDDVKILFSILFFFFSLVPYWMTYFQMETSFVSQALHMRFGLPYSMLPSPIPTNKSTVMESPFPFAEEDNFILPPAPPSPSILPTAQAAPAIISNSTSHTPRFQFPVAWLSLFDVAFLIFFIPIMDYIQRKLDKKGKVIPILLRFYLGIFFALMAVTWAGVLETERLWCYWEGCGGGIPPWNYSSDIYNDSCADSVNQTFLENTTFNAANMSVALQVPQYCLIGISEALASVAGLEFAYSAAPRCMQGLIMGFFWLFTGMGCLLGYGLAAALRGVWFHGDYPSRGLNYDRMDYYYYLLSGILFCSFLFLPCTFFQGATVDRKRKMLREFSRTPNNATSSNVEAVERPRRSRISRARIQKENEAGHPKVDDNTSPANT